VANIAAMEDNANGPVLPSVAAASRVIVLTGTDAAVHEDHVRSMIAALLGPDVMLRKPIGSVSRAGHGGFRIHMLRSRHAETIRAAMNGGVINGSPVTVLFEAPAPGAAYLLIAPTLFERQRPCGIGLHE
jgi:hypothetical protein